MDDQAHDRVEKFLFSLISLNSLFIYKFLLQLLGLYISTERSQASMEVSPQASMHWAQDPPSLPHRLSLLGLLLKFTNLAPGRPRSQRPRQVHALLQILYIKWKARSKKDTLFILLEEDGSGTEGGGMRSGLGHGQKENQKGFMVMVSQWVLYE